jgi:hypothetical protein
MRRSILRPPAHRSAIKAECVVPEPVSGETPGPKFSACCAPAKVMFALVLLAWIAR